MRPSVCSREITSVLAQIILAVVAFHAGLSAQETLTNADVVKMVQAHLSAEVIIQQVENSPGQYVLTTNSLIRLKQAGVPDKVIAAMQAKTKESGQPAHPSSSKAVAKEESRTSEATSVKEGVWHQIETTDPMSDERTTLVVTTVKGNPAGKFDVRAGCIDDSGIGFLFANRSNGLSLKRTPMSQTMNGRVTGSWGGDATEEGSLSAPKSCVVMQIRLGDADVKSMVSYRCENDYETLAVFPGDTSREARRNMNMVGQIMKSASPDQKGAAAMSDLTTILSNWMAAMNAKTMDIASDAGVIMRMKQVLAADSMRVQFPFTDDSSAVIRLNLADPEFRKYTSSRCVAPDTPARGAAATPKLTIPQRPGKLYKGSVASFTAALPKMIDEAGANWNFPPHSFDKEAQYIAALARLCASITPEIANHYANHDPTDLHPGVDGTYAACKPGYKGASMYVRGFPLVACLVCKPPKGDHEHERGLVVILRPLGAWSEGKGIDLTVQFTGIPADNVVGNYFNYYGIVNAELGVAPLPPGTDVGWPARAAPEPQRGSASLLPSAYGASVAKPEATETGETADAHPTGMLTAHPGPPPPASAMPMADVRTQADALWKGKKYTEAVPLYDRACGAGNQGACSSLGLAYFWGNGVAQDDRKGMNLWANACNAGYSDGCVYLSNVLQETGGFSGPANALPFVTKGCDLNEGGSCFALAMDYWSGDSVKQDRDKARQLFQKACDLGVKDACNPSKWSRE